jgi:hypothetical protein
MCQDGGEARRRTIVRKCKIDRWRGSMKFQHEEETENEPLFRRGRHLQSNLLDIEDEEPLFVIELTTEEIDRARQFLNGNGECDEDEDEDTSSITAL